MTSFLELAQLLECAAKALREAHAALSPIGLPAGTGTPIESLGLSVRARKSLRRDDKQDELGPRIETAEQLCLRSAAELLYRRNFGHTSLREVRDALAARGLALRGDPPPSPPG